MFGPVTNTHGASALSLSWPSSSSPLGQAMKMSLGMKSSPKKVLVTQGWRDALRSRKGCDWDPSPGRTISGLAMGPSPLWLYRDMLNSTSGGDNNRKHIILPNIILVPMSQVLGLNLFKAFFGKTFYFSVVYIPRISKMLKFWKKKESQSQFKIKQNGFHGLL